MSEATVKLQSIRVGLDQLYLDPNNPRFAKNLDLPEKVADEKVAEAQQRLYGLFVNEQDSETGVDEDDWQAEVGAVGAVRIGDLVRSMLEIGFVPIDRVVVRKLEGSNSNYVVIEGN